MLKRLLEQENLQYKDIDMTTPAGLTELRMYSIFTMSAPVLQINDKFYTTKEICKQEIIDQDKVDIIIDQDKVMTLLKENL
jgi:glutaredoxin